MVDPVNRRSDYRLPVEVGVQLHVAGVRMTVPATMLNISSTGARVRSWVLLRRGAPLRFDWAGEHAVLEIQGTIVARSACSKGAAYEYGISFAGLDDAKREALAREIEEARESRFGVAPPRENVSANRRQSERAGAQFPVALVFEEQHLVLDATATEVSAGGLRVSCAQPFLHAGDLPIVRFRLPDDALRASPESGTQRLLMTPYGLVRRESNERRPFEEISVRSRVASRLNDAAGNPAYGISFVEIDPYTREEISRYMHAREREGE